MYVQVRTYREGEYIHTYMYKRTGKVSTCKRTGKVSTYVCTYKYERTGKVSTYIRTCTNVQGNLFESDTQWSLMSIRLGGCQITE